MKKRKIKSVMNKIINGNYLKVKYKLHKRDRHGHDSFCIWGAITNEYVKETGDTGSWGTIIPSRNVLDWLGLEFAEKLKVNRSRNVMKANDCSERTLAEIAKEVIKYNKL